MFSEYITTCAWRQTSPTQDQAIRWRLSGFDCKRL